MQKVIIHRDDRTFIGEDNAEGLEGVIIGVLNDLSTPIIRLINGDYILGMHCESEEWIGTPDSFEREMGRRRARFDELVIKDIPPDDLELTLADIYNSKRRPKRQASVVSIDELRPPYEVINPIPVVLEEIQGKQGEKYIVHNPKISIFSRIFGYGKNKSRALGRFARNLARFLDDGLIADSNESNQRSDLYNMLTTKYVKIPDSVDIDSYKSKIRKKREEERERYRGKSERFLSADFIEESIQVPFFKQPIPVSMYKRPSDGLMAIHFKEGKVYFESDPEGGIQPLTMEQCQRHFGRFMISQFLDLRQLRDRTPQQEQKFKLLSSYM